MSLELPKLPDVPRLPSISKPDTGRRGRPKADRALLFQLIRQFPDKIGKDGKKRSQIAKIQREYYVRTGQRISRFTIFNAKRELAGVSEVPEPEESRLWAKRKEFFQNPLILSWIEKLTKRQKPVKTWRQYVNAFYTACRALRVTPENFSLIHGQAFLKKLWGEGKNEIGQWKHFSTAIRSFLMLVKGVSLPKGAGDALGLPNPCSPAKYAHVGLTKEEIPKVREAIESEDYRLMFDVALVSGDRAESLTKIPLDRIEIVEKDGKQVLKFEVFETKEVKNPVEFKGEKGEFWRKWLPVDHRVAKAILERKAEREAKGYDTLFDNGAFLNGFWKALKEAYRKVGIKEPYAYKKASHFLRHTFVQLMLEETGYNYDVVAELGSWHGTTTLKMYYGAIPERAKIRVACEAIPKMVI
jgi:integrase